MKPLVKWVGGKTQLVNKISSLLPEKINTYFEPFFGGGAIGFNLAISNSYFSDLNEDLINLYICIRDDYKKVIYNIEKMRISYNQDPENFFYCLRSEDRKTTFKDKCDYWKSARLIFLNKTCFNGIYRVNSKGQFNAPWNKKEQAPKIYDIENVIKIAKFLKTTKIECHSFEKILDIVKEGDFVYLDPPYDKLNSNSFISYNSSSFDQKEQKELADFLSKIK